MKDIIKTETYQKALDHVVGHAKFREDIAELIEYITENKGDVEFCTMRLRSYAHANAIVSWFRDKDLTALKEWCFISAKLERMVFQFNPYEWFPAYQFFSPLLSDNEDMISWFRQHRISYDSTPGARKDRDNPKQPDFHGYQMILALNQEWDLLRQRCELILGMELKKDRKYLIDHRFYLALANNDKDEMQKVLTELTSPKVVKVRNYEFAFTFTEHFIATHAVIYAKLAWRNGHQLEINTPWIPQEWMPIKPLTQYPEPWDFMRKVDIWKQFDGEDAEWSPKKVYKKDG